jgi:hypothetical protein
MDETLVVAIRAFFATIGPSVADPVTQRAIEKVDEALSRVADGDMAPNDAALYIRDLVTVLS